jgi:hypothetical protein
MDSASRSEMESEPQIPYHPYLATLFIKLSTHPVSDEEPSMPQLLDDDNDGSGQSDRLLAVEPGQHTTIEEGQEEMLQRGSVLEYDGKKL